jgi:serine/threonine-protein kinase
MIEPIGQSTPAPPEPDLSGKQLGDYRLLRRLGRGGMADVYLAEQASLRRRVAFKVLRRSLAQQENYVRRFHNEAHAAAALIHANIVQIYEVGCTAGIHFIAQEYVEGRNLKQVVARKGAIGIPQAVLIMRQVAAALHKAGKEGIVHRDIKPENILIGPGGEAKVADFGLARIITGASNADLTQVGVTMGTPLYMSPEQLEGGSVDLRSDIYSLGVTCYYMLTGRPPFEGETALNIAVQHLKSLPERLENLRPDLPSDLARIVHTMLAKSPDDRYASAGELLRELRQVRVEGLDADWTDQLLDLDASERFALSDSPLEATQRLDALMKQSTQASRHKRALKLWTAGVAIAFLVGSALAWATRRTDVLAIGPHEVLPKVDQKETIEQQYNYAMFVNTDEAFESVLEYFPADAGDISDATERAQIKYYTNLAKKNLAQLYYEDGEYEQALDMYADLADLDSTEEQFRAVGLAGKAIVYARLNLEDEFAATWFEAMSESEHLDPEMRAELNRVLEEYQRQN